MTIDPAFDNKGNNVWTGKPWNPKKRTLAEYLDKEVKKALKEYISQDDGHVSPLWITGSEDYKNDRSAYIQFFLDVDNTEISNKRKLEEALEEWINAHTGPGHDWVDLRQEPSMGELRKSLLRIVEKLDGLQACVPAKYRKKWDDLEKKENNKNISKTTPPVK